MSLLLAVGCSGAAEPVVAAPVVAIDGVGLTVSELTPTPVTPTSRPSPPPELSWETSVREGRKRAIAEKRALLIYVRAEWSVSSLQMERELWPVERVRRHLKPLVLVRLDVTEATDDQDQQLAQLGVHGVPTVIVLQPHGAEAGRLDGTSGPDDVLQLVAALEYD